MITDILALAPLTLKNRRRGRYLGDDFCLPVSAFAAADQERLRELYDFLEEAFRLVSRAHDFDAATVRRVSEWIAQQDLSARIKEVQAFGSESCAAQPSELMGQDRARSARRLSFLLNHLQFAQKQPLEETSLRALFFLTRDHLKIMRNALLELDDAKRTEDLLPKLHGIDFIVREMAARGSWLGRRAGPTRD